MRYLYTPKETKHYYRGCEIIGTYYISSGGSVLGGRYDIPPGAHKRNYIVKKHGKYLWNPKCIVEKLKDAKEEIDEILDKYEAT